MYSMRERRNHEVIKQLDHWVEQLQVISKNIKFLVAL